MTSTEPVRPAARAARCALLALVSLLLMTASARAATRDVLYVGNNWDGTADVVDPQRFIKLARINIIPDLAERMAEIQKDPQALAYFLAVREAVGEGHDQFVDDMFSSPDGKTLYVSRPSLADVVAFDLATRRIMWRVHVAGNRADHMGISPDGTRLLVSASTARTVHVIDTTLGKIVGNFPSGDQPHENNFSADGKLIYHASIGTVFTPGDDPALDAAKGERVFEIVDARTLKVIKKIDMGVKLAEFGREDMSSAVRPMALSPDEKFLYFQVSFFHGFVEYDLVHDRFTRLANLPISAEAAKKTREEYLLDSAHHGLSMNPEGTKLCAAGTVSDYAAIVSRDSFKVLGTINGAKPYWSTNSGDGRYCFVSFSGDDAIAAISYADAREVARISVGDHPQRMRMGKLEGGYLGTDAASLTTQGPRGALPCASRRRFRIRLREPHGDRMASARVTVAGKRVRVTRRAGRLTASVDLRSRPAGVVQVRIVGRTRSGRTVRSARTYRLCAQRRSASR